MGTKTEELAKLARGEGCLAKAKDGEFIFILRSQDITMPTVLHIWIDENQSHLGENHPKILEAKELLDRTRKWQAENGCRYPD